VIVIFLTSHGHSLSAYYIYTKNNKPREDEGSCVCRRATDVHHFFSYKPPDVVKSHSGVWFSHTSAHDIYIYVIACVLGTL
jgi:hypothetical protein